MKSVNHYIHNPLPNEQMIKILRKDFFVLLEKIVFFIFTVGLFAGLSFFFFNLNPNIASQDYFPIVLLFLSVFVLFVWLFFFFSIIDFYLDIWLITNERIVNIKQDGFFSRTISEHRFIKMQDVTSESKGLIRMMFGFGSVYVQTAAEVERFVFEDIPNPDAVRSLLIELSDKKHQEELAKMHQVHEVV